MPKRSSEEKIEYYKNKLKKLEAKIDSSHHPDDQDELDLNTNCLMEEDNTQAAYLEDMPPHLEDMPSELPATEQISDLSGIPEPAEPTPDTEPALDPLLLMALGECTSDSPEFGEKIHENLAQLWTPLLRKGMPKDSKEKLLKEHLVPDNCRLLQAPKLNAEISAAVAESVRGRDKKYLSAQQQLGQGIAAVNRGMQQLFKSDNKVECLKSLSDGCRILSDLHYFFTKDRSKLIIPSIEKSFSHIIQDCERDETLFGNGLAENIKATKAIEKQGQQIKKPPNNYRQNPSSLTAARPTPVQGNYSGHPRFQSNRGGRGGARKPFPPSTIRRAYNSTQTQQKPIYQNRPRAPHQ